MSTYTNYNSSGQAYEKKYYTCAETAKFVRAALKEKWSNFKFSVRSSVYSGGASINIEWMDGPTDKEVEKVVNRFKGADFDGMQDLKTYRNNTDLDGKPCRYGADFIFTRRKFSTAFMTPIVERLARDWGMPAPIIKTHSDGEAYVDVDYATVQEFKLPETFQTLLWREIQDISAIVEKPALAEHAPVKSMLSFVEPSPWHENDLLKPEHYNTPDPAGESVETFAPYVCAICDKEVTVNIVHQEGYTFHDECYNRMMTYQQRRDARYERLLARAERAEKAANSLHEHAHTMASVIPFGQPILVGHHSEGRDRRLKERIEGNYRKEFEHFKKAERLKERAESARKNNTISSDDPAAVLLLKEKLAKLEADQALMVEINKIIRDLVKPPRQTKAQKEAREKEWLEVRKQPGVAALNAFLKAEADEKQQRIAGYIDFAPQLAERAKIKLDLAQKLLKPDFAGRIGVPDYALKNNGAEIRRLKERIENLGKAQEKAETLGDETVKYSGDISIEVNRTDNRVQIFFPGKPAQTVINELKGHGFHWSKWNKAWQRMLNDSALYWANEIVVKFAGAQKL